MRAMRLSDPVVKYAYTRWSEVYVGGIAMPSSPPSPAGDTPGTVPSSVLLPVLPSTRVIVLSSREDTRRSPPGSSARPHGEASPSVSVDTTFTEPIAGGDEDGGGKVEGEEDTAGDEGGGCVVPAASPPVLPEPSLDEHPADIISEPTATAVTIARRATGNPRGQSTRALTDPNTEARTAPIPSTAA